MNRRLFAAFALAALFACAGACTTTAPNNSNTAATTPTPAAATTAALPAELKPALDSVNADDLLRHIKELSSDAYEGRGPGTEGENKTVSYIAEQFKKLGLKPAHTLYHWLRDALAHFEHAAELAVADNADALLRWNSTARLLNAHPEMAPKASDDPGGEGYGWDEPPGGGA